MRTTIVIDPEIAQQVKQIMAETRRSMRKVVNDLLRKALAESRAGKKQGRYVLKPFASGEPRGFIPGRANQLYDELEIARFTEESRHLVHEARPAYKRRGK